MRDKQQAEEEIICLSLASQATATEKETLYQQVQKLTRVIEDLRSSTLKSVDQIISSLNSDLEVFGARPYRTQDY